MRGLSLGSPNAEEVVLAKGYLHQPPAFFTPLVQDMNDDLHIGVRGVIEEALGLGIAMTMPGPNGFGACPSSLRTFSASSGG